MTSLQPTVIIQLVHFINIFYSELILHQVYDLQ